MPKIHFRGSGVRRFQKRKGGMYKKVIQHLVVHPAHQRLLNEFTTYLKVTGYAKGSIRSKVASAKEFIYCIEQKDIALTEVISQTIKDHYAYLLERPNYNTDGGLSSSTITGHLYGIRLFFSYLQKVNYLSVHPMSVLSFPKGKNAPRQILTTEEIKLLYAACKDERERALLGLFYGCGLRRSEAVKLNLRDVDFRGLWLYVRSGKGKKRRVVPMTPKVAETFKIYCIKYRPNQIGKWTKPSDSKAFMLNKIGTRMKGCAYWNLFKVILKRTKLHKTTSLHHLRHSIATHLLMGGMSIEKVRDFLGHQFLETTQIYTHIITEELDLWNEPPPT